MAQRTIMVCDRDQARAFVDYASDTEGMQYTATQVAGAWRVTCDKDYNPKVERALVRNFKDEWKMVTSRPRSRS